MTANGGGQGAAAGADGRSRRQTADGRRQTADGRRQTAEAEADSRSCRQKSRRPGASLPTAQATQVNTIEALRGIDEGVIKLGPVVTLQLYAVELELRLKNYDTALARLETIAAQSQRKETWIFRRGEILLLAGGKAEAHEAFARALAALESLPPHSRRTRATADLEARLRTASPAETTRLIPEVVEIKFYFPSSFFSIAAPFPLPGFSSRDFL